MAEPVIVAAGVTRQADWLDLRGALWPGEDHVPAIAAMLARPSPDRLTLIAIEGDRAVGLAEASIRHDHVNGCDTSPVAFVEGLYVVPDRRRRGIARRLVEDIAAWSRDRGTSELASDAPLDREASHRLHVALGFGETERVVFFRRRLRA